MFNRGIKSLICSILLLPLSLQATTNSEITLEGDVFAPASSELSHFDGSCENLDNSSATDCDTGVGFSVKAMTYTRVGDVVNVSGIVAIRAKLSNTNTVFFIPLPISSDLSSSNELHGLAVHSAEATLMNNSLYGCSGTEVSGVWGARCKGKPSVTTQNTMVVNFQYIIK